MLCPQIQVAQAAQLLRGVFCDEGPCVELIAFAFGLPNIAAGHIFECGLAGPPGALDYSVAIQARADRISHLVEQRGAAFLRVPEMLGASASARLIWMEYDADKTGSFGAPSFFLAPADLPSPHAPAAALARGLFSAIAPHVSSVPDVELVLSRLPRGAFLRQAGMMAGRGGSPAQVRLVVDAISAGEIPAVLAELGWPGPMENAVRLAALAESHVGQKACIIDLDLGSRLGPTLGIELPARSLQNVDALATDLMRMGLATAPKAAGLRDLAAMRILGAKDAPELPPLGFGLNHVKLVVGQHGAVSDAAKAYFSLVAVPDIRRPAVPPSGPKSDTVPV